MNSNKRVYRSKCPVCRKGVQTTDIIGHRYFPFCSERCKLIDLGHWFQGDYRIAGPPDEVDDTDEPGRDASPEDREEPGS